jgi:heavy metal translocating P-type ATPase
MMEHNYFLFVLASINLFVFGRGFLIAIVRFIKSHTANMDTLIGLGTTTAYIYSGFILFFGSQAKSFGLTGLMYFDATAVVIGFILFGKYLEAQSKTKTGEAIGKLISLQAKTAIVIRNEKEIEIPIEDVVVDDQILIKPGAKIPVDGKIISGNSSIDESTITGESIPVDKETGDSVIGGTINKHGSFIFKASKVGNNTMLAQIIQMVADAQGSKAPIERLADQVSAVFVPVVLVLALVTFIGWSLFGSSIPIAISSLVAVLVIACPCALGLATPTGIIVGVGKGAENGILVKDAESLEKLHSINAVVVDKTGTITTGKPIVTNIVVTGKTTQDELLSIAASLESLSEHPLAKNVVQKARETKINIQKVTNFLNLEGKGISGTIDGKKYYAGSRKLMNFLNIKVSNDKKFEKEGKTPIYITLGEESLLGAIYLADTLKENAAIAIAKLQKNGIEVIMATGDDQDTAQFIAGLAGIKSVYATSLPQDKAKLVQELQAKGKLVAMVGDGVNDAPALAAADVGIAMSTGTDIAIESASITLLHGDIMKVEKAIALSKATMSVIKQNLFWAFIYNIVGIPIAAGILYPFFGILLSPIFAGAAMALSSVSVVTNSLRLKTVRI